VPLMKPTESWAMTADGAAMRKGWAAEHELALRNAMEDLLRGRRPGARICHEMVMGAREVRADVVAIDTDHIVAVEVKGEGDDVSRLLHQVGLYQLCVPEVWMVISADKKDSGRLVKYLMPSVGLIVGHNLVPEWRIQRQPAHIRLEIEAEPVPRPPHPRLMLEMMWAEELATICSRTGALGIRSRLPRRAFMIDALIENVQPVDILRECCTELRARHALWRADAPITAMPNTGLAP
jgi:hypothetical protein